jgi:hypothetical protein
MPTKRKRYMVSLPKGTERRVLKRAKTQQRSVANYIEHLIMADLATQEQPQASYITQKPLDEPTGPPNPSLRHRAGPDAEVRKPA